MSSETVTINDIQIPVSALEAAGFKREVKQGGRYKPKVGETYWKLYSDGDWAADKWLDTKIDKDRYAMGNTFRTKEDAIAARDKQLALVRVQDKLAEMTNEPLDWNNGGQMKCALMFNHEDRLCWQSFETKKQVIGGLYGAAGACDWVIDNMQSDLKLIEGIA